MRPFLVLGSLLSLSSGPLAAQAAAPADSLMDRMIGHWVLRGPMAGQPEVVHDVTFEWVLNREYVRMHETSRERTAAGAPAYEAIVYIANLPGTRRYRVLWLDNTATWDFEGTGIGRAEAAGDSIPFVWRTSERDGFLNTFVYDRARDTWQWHMDNEQAGARRVFARVTLTRQQEGR